MSRQASGPSVQVGIGGRILLRQRFLVLVLLFMVACAAPRPLAVPEQILALREDLPLDDVKRARVVHFIAAGGQQREENTITTPVPAVERDFGLFLDLLKDPQNLRFIDFERRLSAIVRLEGREIPVIDARERHPDELGRVAYHLQNFWFVFYAEKESPEGDPLPAGMWVFDRMVVFRDRPPK